MTNQFGERLRQLREKQDLFLRQVASALEMDTAHLSKIEKGVRQLKKEQIAIVADVLNADKDELTTLWLADQVIGVVKDDSLGLKALQVAEHEIKQKKKQGLMAVEAGHIVKNLSTTEPVTINQIRSMGKMISLKYTGINSNKVNSKVISKEDFDALEVLADEGSFNFQGDPIKFTLYAEAERINSAYQFDPLFAVNCSIVDPLPHQIEAVYKFLFAFAHDSVSFGR